MRIACCKVNCFCSLYCVSWHFAVMKRLSSPPVEVAYLVPVFVCHDKSCWSICFHVINHWINVHSRFDHCLLITWVDEILSNCGYKWCFSSKCGADHCHIGCSSSIQIFHGQNRSRLVSRWKFINCHNIVECSMSNCQ